MFCFSGNISGWRVERFTIRSKDEMELRLLSQGIRHTSLPPSLSLSLSATHAHALIHNYSLSSSPSHKHTHSLLHTHTRTLSLTHTHFLPTLILVIKRTQRAEGFSLYLCTFLSRTQSLSVAQTLALCLSVSLLLLLRLEKPKSGRVMMEQLSFHPDLFFFFQIFERFMFFSSRCC